MSPLVRPAELFAAALVLGLPLCAAMGQESPESREQPPAVQPEAAPPERPIRYSIRARGEMGFRSDLSDSPGDVSVSRAGVNVAAAIPVGQRGQLGVAFDYEFSSYDFEDATGFVPGVESPFGDIHRETISLSYAQQFSRRWSLVSGGSIGLSGEEGADTGESLFGSGYIGGRYSLSETVQAGFGLVFATQIEDDTLFLPLVMVDWQINERWSLSNDGKLGLTLAYAPSEAWRFSLGADYQTRDFRLDEDGPIPGGVGRDQRVPLTLGATFTPTPRVIIDLSVGVNLFQNYEVLDRNGVELADVDAEAAPFVGLQIGYRF